MTVRNVFLPLACLLFVSTPGWAQTPAEPPPPLPATPLRIVPAQAAQGQRPAVPDRTARQLLTVPPEALIRKGIGPLSEDLPDTQVIDGLLPPDASQGFFNELENRETTFRQGDWTLTEFHWAASELRHRPLYFEDAVLERYGQSHAPLFQPLVSGTRFFLTFPVLPYAATVNPPRPAISALGYFRPGSRTPALRQRPPLQRDAAFVQALSALSFIFIFP